MTPAEREELTRALDCIHPDLPRDEWIMVLMGLHSEGEEELAREWSARGHKWDPHAFDGAWRSLRARGNGHAPVTLASVYHIAKEYGFVPSGPRTVRVRRAPAPTLLHADASANDTAPAAAQVAACVDSPPAVTPFTRFVSGTDAREHPYVVRKRMGAERLRIVRTWDDRLELGALYVSVSTGAPVTVQVIDASGKRKRNWPGYPLRDGAWRVRGDGALVGDETTYVCEGVATAWACVEAVGEGEGYATAGKANLRAVAEALRRRYPALDIVIVSDRDAVDAATRAARACAGRVAVIPADIVPGNPKTDAWDALDAHGPAALAEILAAASEPEPQTGEASSVPQVGIAAILDAMRADEMLVGLLGFDCMRGRIVLMKARPWPSALPGWTDNDIANVELRLAQRGVRAPVDSVARACRMLAEGNAFHPVCRWLDSLHWDGVRRVDAWLVTHLGAEDMPYSREVGRILLLSMVARVRFPASKCDTMIVLEGRQGVGKSRTLAVLGGEWFSDCMPDLDDLRACGEGLRGVWLLENSEIVALRRHEVEAQKAFLSRQTDSYRPAYGREVIEQPRQCIVVGTTNRLDGYLMDDSGGRRFLPVRVGHCDVEAVARDREQLFAEASARIAGGESWWIEDGTLLAAAADEAEERLAENPWFDRVRQYVGRPGAPEALLVPAIFEALTGHAYESRNLVDGRQIAAALRDLGYVRRKRTGTRFFVREDGALGGALS